MLPATLLVVALPFLSLCPPVHLPKQTFLASTSRGNQRHHMTRKGLTGIHEDTKAVLEALSTHGSQVPSGC